MFVTPLRQCTALLLPCLLGMPFLLSLVGIDFGTNVSNVAMLVRLLLCFCFCAFAFVCVCVCSFRQHTNKRVGDDTYRRVTYSEWTVRTVSFAFAIAIAFAFALCCDCDWSARFQLKVGLCFLLCLQCSVA